MIFLFLIISIFFEITPAYQFSDFSFKKIVSIATLLSMVSAAGIHDMSLNSTENLPLSVCPIPRTHTECDQLYADCDRRHWDMVTGVKFKKMEKIQIILHDREQKSEKKAKQKEDACIQKCTQSCKAVTADAQKAIMVKDPVWEQYFTLLEERNRDGAKCWDGWLKIHKLGYWSKSYWSGCSYSEDFAKWLPCSKKDKQLNVLERKISFYITRFNEFEEKVELKEVECTQECTQGCQKITIEEQEVLKAAVQKDLLFQEWSDLKKEQASDYAKCTKLLLTCHNNVADFIQELNHKIKDVAWSRYQKQHPEARSYKNLRQWVCSDTFAKLYNRQNI